MRLRSMFILLAAGSALFAGQAAAKPFAPKGAVVGPEYAELVFTLGIADTVSLGSAKLQEYRISETNRFNDGKLVKLFTWAHKKPKSIIHPAGRKIYVFALLKRIFGAPGITDSGSDSCLNASAFTPRPNSRYRIVQSGSPYGACRISIIDLATGQEPEGVEPLLFEPSPPTK